jgi:hypothetical protein
VPGECSSIVNMKNPSGVYLKTLCLVRTLYNQDTARLRCAESNMELMTINSAEVGVAVMSTLNSQFGSGNILIEGKNGTACTGLYKANSTSYPYVKNLSCGSGFYSYCGYKSKTTFLLLKIHLFILNIFYRNVGFIVALNIQERFQSLMKQKLLGEKEKYFFLNYLVQ